MVNLMFILILSILIHTLLVMRQINALSKLKKNEATHAKAYMIKKTKLLNVSWGLEILLIIFWFYLGGLQMLSDFWSSFKLDKPLTGTLLLLSLMGAQQSIRFLFSLYRQKIEAQFGFRTLQVKSSLIEFIKKISLYGLLIAPWLLLTLEAVEKSRRWGVVLWVSIMLLVIAWNGVYPSMIAPKFQRYKKLQNKALKSRLKERLQELGFKGSHIYVLEESKKSKLSNAHMLGFGKSKQVILFDNLLSLLNENEIEAVVIHELGHFKHHHQFKLLIVFGFILALIIAGIKTSVFINSGLIPHSPYLPESTLLIAALYILWPLILFFMMPLLKYMFRQFEFQADSFSARYISAQYLIDALKKLNQNNATPTSPDKWFSFWFDSHPSLLKRIKQLQ